MSRVDLMLSERQRRLAARRRRIGLVSAPLLAGAALWLVPDNMSPAAAHLMALIAATFPLWISDALPAAVTALAAPAVGVLVGIAPAAEMFAPFAHPIVWLLVGASFLGAAIERTRLDRKLAAAAMPRQRATLARTIGRIGTVAGLLSAIRPGASSAAMMVPALREGAGRFGRRAEATGLLGVARMTAIGGLLTPIGAPSNLIAIAAIGQYGGLDLPFLHWCAIAIVVVLPLWLLWRVALRVRLGASGGHVVHGDLALAGSSPPTTAAFKAVVSRPLAWGLDRGQFYTALVIGAALLLWLLPGAMALFVASTDAASTTPGDFMPASVVALLAAACLFVLPAATRRVAGVEQRRPVLTWGEATGIDWGEILLLGGGLALGHQLVATGLSHWLGDLAVRYLALEGDVALTWMFTAAALALTQVARNTATAAVLCPLAVVAAQQVGASPVAPCVATAMATSLAFCLPLSSDANAVVFATGQIEGRHMARNGVIAAAFGLLIVPPVAIAASRLLAMF